MNDTDLQRVTCLFKLLNICDKTSYYFVNIQGQFFQIEWILFKPCKLFTGKYVFKTNQLFDVMCTSVKFSIVIKALFYLDVRTI
jgi:hypothetical protein